MSFKPPQKLSGTEEKIIRWLMYNARTVTAEQLTHRGMSDDFVFRGRDCAVHDHHYAALSLYLNAADIPFVRVDPAGTSQNCGACLERTGQYQKGQRHGAHFYCPTCGWQGCAHTNAARVILHRGLKLHSGPPRDSALLVRCTPAPEPSPSGRGLDKRVKPSRDA